jgi:hypothetical protein
MLLARNEATTVAPDNANTFAVSSNLHYGSPGMPCGVFSEEAGELPERRTGVPTANMRTEEIAGPAVAPDCGTRVPIGLLTEALYSACAENFPCGKFFTCNGFTGDTLIST